MPLDIGVGLWTMQSTASYPHSIPGQYRAFPDEARHVEELGFGSLWLGEHRFWYDAWVPAPMLPIAAGVAATSTLRFGTAMMLLPQHDPDRLAATAASLNALGGRRFDVGVGLGHRDAEYDGLGIARPSRGRRMDAGLDRLTAPVYGLAPDTIWVGGMAEAALRRLGCRGMSAMLPQTLDERALRGAVHTIGEAAAAADVPRGRIGVLKDVWVDTDGARAREWFLPRLRDHYQEEAGAWWVLKGRGHGFSQRDVLDRQVDRVVASAIVGDPGEVAERLAELPACGVDKVVVRLNFDFTYGPALRRALELFAGSVLPLVRAATVEAVTA
ncbi:LLM class flavin-dependent oxidoreductase [Microbispora sp. NBRC 16548]|uniref:LLM class flavin-dependent oxidoreductase n=1 Tax=Microbispora sp. NBRC 16548 TaxID=3030994 RepID=UPI0024A3DF98|nr:LLM class flavin-dependent oxidoreductase [Microbispora sp. NBRC 16548]GLX11120.1 hypothetical protein Misp03_80460 [Microbispora sp. NBRC 16548]